MVFLATGTVDPFIGLLILHVLFSHSEIIASIAHDNLPICCLVLSSQFNVNKGSVDRVVVDGDGLDRLNEFRYGLDDRGGGLDDRDGGENRGGDGLDGSRQGMNHFDIHSQAPDGLNVAECQIPCNHFAIQIVLSRGLLRVLREEGFNEGILHFGSIGEKVAEDGGGFDLH